MNFLERAAMKILERGMRNQDKTRRPGINDIDVSHRVVSGTAGTARREHTGEIVLSDNPTPQEIERLQVELLYYRALAVRREAELLKLQRMDTLGSIEERHREKQIRAYEQDIERLNLMTPGGCRSQPIAEAGEDQELVNEAWLRFCARRRGGGSR